LVAVSCFAENEPVTPDFTGRWITYDVVGYSEISEGVKEAKRLLGKVLIISKNRIDFDDESCKPNNGFSVGMVDAATKFTHYYGKFYLPDLGLQERAMLLESDNCMPIFKLSDHIVIFGRNGVILRAYK